MSDGSESSSLEQSGSSWKRGRTEEDEDQLPRIDKRKQRKVDDNSFENDGDDEGDSNDNDNATDDSSGEAEGSNEGTDDTNEGTDPSLGTEHSHETGETSSSAERGTDESTPASTPSMNYTSDIEFDSSPPDAGHSENISVRTARRGLRVAFDAIAMIETHLAGKPGGPTDQPWGEHLWEQPWFHLSEAMCVLQDSMQDYMVTRVPEILRCFELLMAMLITANDRRIEPDLVYLADSKEYKRSLPKAEGKALHPFMVRYLGLEQTPIHVDAKDCEFLIRCPRNVLARFAECALTQSTALKLSNSGLDHDLLNDRANLAACVKLFRIPTRQIVAVDLSHNSLTHLPKGFGNWFPQLKTLYLAKNPIMRFPLSLLSTNLKYIFAWQTDNEYDDSYVKYNVLNRFLAPPAVKVTLVEHCYHMICKHYDLLKDRLPTLPERLQHIINAELCEVCGRPCPHRYTPLSLVFFQRHLMEGVICVRCFDLICFPAEDDRSGGIEGRWGEAVAAEYRALRPSEATVTLATPPDWEREGYEGPDPDLLQFALVEATTSP